MIWKGDFRFVDLLTPFSASWKSNEFYYCLNLSSGPSRISMKFAQSNSIFLWFEMRSKDEENLWHYSTAVLLGRNIFLNLFDFQNSAFICLWNWGELRDLRAINFGSRLSYQLMNDSKVMTWHASREPSNLENLLRAILNAIMIGCCA